MVGMESGDNNSTNGLLIMIVIKDGVGEGDG